MVPASDTAVTAMPRNCPDYSSKGSTNTSSKEDHREHRGKLQPESVAKRRKAKEAENREGSDGARETSQDLNIALSRDEEDMLVMLLGASLLKGQDPMEIVALKVHRSPLYIRSYFSLLSKRLEAEGFGTNVGRSTLPGDIEGSSQRKRKYDELVDEDESSEYEHPEMPRVLRPRHNGACTASIEQVVRPSSENSSFKSLTYDDSDSEDPRFIQEDDHQSDEEEYSLTSPIQEDELQFINNTATRKQPCLLVSGDPGALVDSTNNLSDGSDDDLDAFINDENTDEEDTEYQLGESDERDPQEKHVRDETPQIKSQKPASQSSLPVGNLDSLKFDGEGLGCSFDSRYVEKELPTPIPSSKNVSDDDRKEKVEETTVEVKFPELDDQSWMQSDNADFDDFDDAFECFFDHEGDEESIQETTPISETDSRGMAEERTPNFQACLSHKPGMNAEHARDQLNLKVSKPEEPGEEITEYEMQRQRNIAKNEALLRELQLEILSAGLAPPGDKPKNQRKGPRQDRKKMEPTRASVPFQERAANSEKQGANSHVESQHLPREDPPATRETGRNLLRKSSRLVVVELTTDDEEDELA